MVDRERPTTPDQCKKYHTDMAAFHMACADRLDIDLSVITKWYGHTEQELLELKKFLLLKSIKNDVGLIPTMSPSEKVEEMWIDFMKFPSLYHKFCSTLVEIKGVREDDGEVHITQYSIIDHIPLRDPINTYTTFKNTLREYNHFFDYSAMGELWRNPFSSDNNDSDLEISPKSPRLRQSSASTRQSSASTKYLGSSNIDKEKNHDIGSVENSCESKSKKRLGFEPVEISSESKSKKRLGFLPKEEEEEDEIMKWSKEYDGKVREKEELLIRPKTSPRFGVKISSSSNGGGAQEKRGRNNSITSVSSSEEIEKEAIKSEQIEVISFANDKEHVKDNSVANDKEHAKDKKMERDGKHPKTPKSDSKPRPRGAAPTSKNGKMDWDFKEGFWIDRENGEIKYSQVKK